MDDFQVQGMDDLLARLHDLPFVLQNKAGKRAGQAGAEIILHDMEFRIPVRTGAGLRTLMIKDDSNGFEGQQVRFLIGPDKKAAWRLRFIEFGVAPHEIKAKHSRVMVDRNGVIYGTRVEHPGFAARPFIRPALDEKGAEAQAAIWEVLAAQIDELDATI